MKRRSSYFRRRPRTTTTLWDIKRMFKKHPIKTALALPVAGILLGGQMILFYATIPFVVLNNALSNY